MNKKSDALRLYKALRLFVLPNFPSPTFIPCPTSIPDYMLYKFFNKWDCSYISISKYSGQKVALYSNLSSTSYLTTVH